MITLSILFINDKNFTMNFSFNVVYTAFFNKSTISEITCYNEISRIEKRYSAFINGSIHLRAEFKVLKYSSINGTHK